MQIKTEHNRIIEGTMVAFGLFLMVLFTFVSPSSLPSSAHFLIDYIPFQVTIQVSGVIGFHPQIKIFACKFRPFSELLIRTNPLLTHLQIHNNLIG